MATLNAVNTNLSGQSGSGSFAGTISPSFTTPTIGDATATSINLGGGALSSYIPPTFWAPGFSFDTPGNLSVSYANQSGSYVTIGNIVFYGFNLQFTPTYTTASGNARITGLPTNNATEACLGGLNPITGFSLTGSNTSSSLISVQVAKYFNILLRGGTAANAGIGNFTTGVACQLEGSGFYFI